MATLEEEEIKGWKSIREVCEIIPICRDMESAFVEMSKSALAVNHDKEKFSALLQKIVKALNPGHSECMSSMLHSRRHLMFSLLFLWSGDQQARDLVVRTLCNMFEHLEKFIFHDSEDQVFYDRRDIFQRIISDCTLDEVVQLTQCILKASLNAVHSYLGMFLIGRLIERADQVDFAFSTGWIVDCLPRLAVHIASEPNEDILYHCLGSPSLEHVRRNQTYFGLRRKITKTP